MAMFHSHSVIHFVCYLIRQTMGSFISYSWIAQKYLLSTSNQPIGTYRLPSRSGTSIYHIHSFDVHNATLWMQSETSEHVCRPRVYLFSFFFLFFQMKYSKYLNRTELNFMEETNVTQTHIHCTFGVTVVRNSRLEMCFRSICIHLNL